MMTFPTEWKNKKCSKAPTRECREIAHFSGASQHLLQAFVGKVDAQLLKGIDLQMESSSQVGW
jgi:hypothetical protein